MATTPPPISPWLYRRPTGSSALRSARSTVVSSSCGRPGSSADCPISMRYATPVIAAMVLVSCNRDPQYLKQAYLNRGIDFFRAGKTREAGIYYRKAIGQDRRFGEAW